MKRRKTDAKRIGEWVELRFLARAAEAGLTISKPYGDSAPFDFVVGRRAPLHRVQVRGTSVELKGGYGVPVAHGSVRPRRYKPTDFDFLAAHVIPHNAWYIIPFKVIGRQRFLRFRPQDGTASAGRAKAARTGNAGDGGSRQSKSETEARRGALRWEVYREAWHLLGGSGELVKR